MLREQHGLLTQSLLGSPEKPLDATQLRTAFTSQQSEAYRATEPYTRDCGRVWERSWRGGCAKGLQPKQPVRR